MLIETIKILFRKAIALYLILQKFLINLERKMYLLHCLLHSQCRVILASVAGICLRFIGVFGQTHSSPSAVRRIEVGQTLDA
jgi:hypothetical protein